MTLKTKLLRKLVVIGLWMLCVGSAHADGFCGPGAYDPNNGRAPAISCIPIQGYEQPTPQPPPQQWSRRWGAIATGGALGVAIDKLSKPEASQTAINDCAEKGGKNCKIEITYYNQCAAVIEAEDGSYNTPSNVTLEGAVAAGMKTCRDAGHTNCHVYYSACSLPVRIR